MSLIWATRGWGWGFRFLRDGGLADPLPEYERCFPPDAADLDPVRHVGDMVALRLVDPEGRCDRSGRVIVHEFVLDGELATQVNSADDVLGVVWPLVRDEFASVWDRPDPCRRR